MATDLVIQRIASRIVPTSMIDVETLESVPQRVDLACRLWQPRSLPRQRFYRGLLALVVRGTGRFPSAEALHRFLKIKYGLIDAIDTSTDKPIFILGSTAFDAMDETEFGRFVDFAVLTILTEILPGVKEATVIREGEEMIGTPRMAA